MIWALGGPLGAQEGQNHMFEDAQLHFDLVPARIDLRFGISSSPLLFFPVQEFLRISSIAVFRKLANLKLAVSRSSWTHLERCALKS